MKKIISFAAIILALGLLAGCFSVRDNEKEMFLNGAVVVEYKQFNTRSSDDFLSFMFYESGAYEIRFEGKGLRGTTPEDFSIAVENPPREYIVKQYALPDTLKVIIIRNGDCRDEYTFK